MLLYFLAYTIFSIAHAEVINDCYDQKGQVVKVIYNNNSQNLAVALEKTGTPSVTIINPNLMKMFSIPTQTFIRWHECGHHSLGHLINNSAATMIQEQESDCYGIRVALTLDLIKHADLDNIQKEISSIGIGDWQHFAGATRSLNIQKCLGKGYKEEPWKVCKEKFYSNLNIFKAANASLKRMIGVCKKFGNKSSQCSENKSLGMELHKGLTSSTGLIDQECSYVMDPIFTKVMFDYGQVFMKLNNQK